MLYNEFIEGTGCKANEHNYKVYRDLEIMYMNSEMTKQEIYEYGKKLVDNSKSEEQIRFENEVKAEIEDLKAEIEERKEWIESEKWYVNYWKMHGDKQMASFYRNSIRFWKGEIKERRNRISALKWVLE